MFYEVMKFLARPLVYILFWPIVKYRDKIPTTGPGIYAGNHIGVGESILIMVMSHHQVTFPAKQELFRTDTLLHKMGAWFLRMIHQVPMDRTGGDAASDALGSIYEVLQDKGYIAILPEGHRSPDGRLYKGRTGVARLALNSGAPVIPFGCLRTRFVRKKFMPFPWMIRPEIRFGDPFTFPEETRRAFLDATDREEAKKVLREATDEIMNRIAEITGQEMVDEYSYRPHKSAS